MQEVQENLEEVYAIDEQLQRADAQEEGAMDVLKGIQVRSTPYHTNIVSLHNRHAS